MNKEYITVGLYYFLSTVLRKLDYGKEEYSISDLIKVLKLEYPCTINQTIHQQINGEYEIEVPTEQSVANTEIVFLSENAVVSNPLDLTAIDSIIRSGKAYTLLETAEKIMTAARKEYEDKLSLRKSETVPTNPVQNDRAVDLGDDIVNLLWTGSNNE